MSGGRFTNQDRIRPGAYLNFEGVVQFENRGNTRGTVIMPAILGTGKDGSVVTITNEDIAARRLQEKTGRDKGTLNDLVLAALDNAHTIKLVKMNSGGKPAKVVVDEGKLEVEAAHPGVMGNLISVSVEPLGEKRIVSTYLNAIKRDEQIVDNYPNLKDNSLVKFTTKEDATENTAIVPTLLTGGENGTVLPQAQIDLETHLTKELYNTVAIYTTDEMTLEKEDLIKVVKDLRDNKGKKVQAVVNNVANVNHEGIISTMNQGIKYEDGTELDGEGFVVWLAGATAAASINQSNTYKVVRGASIITGELSDEDIEKGIMGGYAVISYRRDGKVVLEKDINTLVITNDHKTPVFKQNQTIRVLDEINNFVSNEFEINYIGKVNVTEAGTTLFKSTIVGYLLDLQKQNAIKNFNSTQDVLVREGEQPESFVVELAIQPTQAVEKLYMTVHVR